jgi:protein phosphatase
VRAWLEEANVAVYDAANADPELSGMGTTAVAAFVGDGVVVIGHVGDSRAYRVRGGSLERLTKDHTFVGELLDGGVLTPEQAAKHPARGQLLRALGRGRDVSPAIAVHDAADGDLFLLCSDGLTGMVGEAEVAAFLQLPVPLHDIADRLIEAANAGGGKDNITVALFRLAVDDDQRAQTTVTNRIIRS